MRKQCDGCGRRVALKAGFGLGVGLVLSPAEALAQAAAASQRPQTGDLLIRLGDATMTPLTAADIKADGPPVMAWPLDAAAKVVRNGVRTNLLIVIRVAPETMSASTKVAAAEGVVAYSALCSHAGCDLTTDQGMMVCDCHSAIFDPKDGGKVVDGPTSRPQPALPLKVAEGTLTVAGPFTAPIQFDQ